MSSNKKIMVVSFQSLSAKSGEGMARLGFFLCQELHKRGLLKTFIVHSKGKHTTSFPSESVSSLSRYYLFIINKLTKVFNIKSHKSRFIQERLFDRFCSFKVDRSINLLLTTQPYLKLTLRKAQRLGIKTFVLPGTPEDNYIYGITSAENNKMNATEVDGYTYDKRNAYYNESIKYADLIIGFFPNTYKTYMESKEFRGNAVELIGHMPPDLAPVTLQHKDPQRTPFKIGFLAYTVVLKGLQYLLEAWQQLQQENKMPDAELYIAGPIHPTVQAYINQNFKNLSKVNYIGQVHNVGVFMKDLDLFVVPSLVDAGPASALEAAHYAVPVIITDNSGSSELLNRGEQGAHVIPIKNAEAIKEKIWWAYTHREENVQMGLNAKYNLQHYSFDDYIQELTNFLETELNN